MAKTNMNNKPKKSKKKGKNAGKKSNKRPQHVRKRNGRMSKAAEKYGADLVATGALKAQSSLKLQEGHTVVAHLPALFCLQDNMHLVSAVSSATSFSFGKEVYCQCKDVAAAVELVSQYESKRKHAKNKVVKARRFGPSFCASISQAANAKILSIVKLDPRTRYNDLIDIFPNAVDIDMKKTSAKVAFSDAAQCQQGYSVSMNTLRWPYGAKAKVLLPDTEEEEAAAEADGRLGKFPAALVWDARVVTLQLQHKFDFRADMALLHTMAEAERIYFPPSFAAVFPVRSAARRAKDALCQHTLAGQRLDCYIHFGQDSAPPPATAGPNKEVQRQHQEVADEEDGGDPMEDNLDSSSDADSDDEGAAVPKRLL